MERLFVYGTLAPGRSNHRLLRGIEGSWSPAGVRGWLHPEGWGATEGFPALELDERGGEVRGFLLTAERLAEQWASLDEFEGSAYERVSTEVRLDDGRVARAWVYVLRRPPGR